KNIFIDFLLSPSPTLPLSHSPTLPLYSNSIVSTEEPQFLGELALMLGIPRTATVRAIEDTILFAINKKGFEKILQTQPELYDVIVQELGKHKEELSERQKQLREMGLVDEDEDDKNPIDWVKKRLKNLFNLELGARG
ncbi:cyclic nucleotide-binding domain-containing protein, partial [Argonema antarcticum]|uniref:cyclic nucleotide-binding domain-containing protein n=1 Tax=Argonema antarcticum TaxID=2942763 RepID=UPI0020119961